MKATTRYRAERLETRVKHPFCGAWCQDESTTFRDYEDPAIATALAKNPTGPLAFQPRRVVQIVTTETVYYATE